MDIIKDNIFSTKQTNSAGLDRLEQDILTGDILKYKYVMRLFNRTLSVYIILELFQTYFWTYLYALIRN